MDEKKIIILDLIEASKIIKNSQADGGEFTKEIRAINNAIKFLKKNNGKK